MPTDSEAAGNSAAGLRYDDRWAANEQRAGAMDREAAPRTRC